MKRASSFVWSGAVAGVLAIAGCYDVGLKTDVLVTAFNNGALDTGNGDPFVTPRDAATQLVVDRVTQELGDAYFDQGSTSSLVASWMTGVANDVDAFVALVVELDCLNDLHIGSMCPYPAPPVADAGTPAVATAPPATSSRDARRLEMRSKVRSFARKHLGATLGRAAAAGAPEGSVCTGNALKRSVAQEFLDFIRFEAAVDRAAHAAAGLLAQGLVHERDVKEGAQRAFLNAARYMEDRGWHRSFDRKTLALVTSGGAATGVFTAGAVWAVLNLVNECMNDASCVPPGTDLRFELASGTSTGAVVNTTVDAFNTPSTHDGRTTELKKMTGYFTCSGVSDLYCTRSAPLVSLLQEGPGAQDSLLEFRGLIEQLRGATLCSQIRGTQNMSELILNTVDFRSGRLLSLSDQEEFSIRSKEDLVQATIASAALPVIVRPVYKLPANPDPSRNQGYLDGGIRSEVPVMAVVRRGAERVLVIGSDSSVASSSNLPPNGLRMAARYIDVTLDGLVETELSESQAYAQALRLAEMDACSDELDPATGYSKGLCPPDRPGCRDALCKADWGQVCAPSPPAGPSPPPSSPLPAKPSLGKPSLDIQMEPFWEMESIFRDPRVEPLHGYAFDPTQSQRLFLAGAEAIRTSCVSVAKLIGIPVPSDPADPLRSRLAAWCSPSLPADACSGFVSPGADAGTNACVVPPPANDATADCRQHPEIP
ncbi:MAG TPA: patatin-like phospholipase family protein [Polyangiaceae bacterium]|nr:patatin-like phospholipase family protein [Polyangiaceae bacterium]